MPHGTTLNTPWPEVGVSGAKQWRQAWPELVASENIDPLQEAADFYICEGLAYSGFIDTKPRKLPDEYSVRRAAERLRLTVEDIRRREERISNLPEVRVASVLSEISSRAEQLLAQQVERLDPVFCSYVHMAVGGELRHHRAIGGSTLSTDRSAAWTGWKKVIDCYGIDALLKAAELFREFSSNAYGNEKWAVSAELLHQRLTWTLGPDQFSSKKLFVDRVFTLEHNGGCFLNKLSWANKRRNRTGDAREFQIGNMKSMLDYHHSNPPNIIGLVEFASPNVVELALEFAKTTRETNIKIHGLWNHGRATSLETRIKGNAEAQITAQAQAIVNDLFDKNRHVCSGEDYVVNTVDLTSSPDLHSDLIGPVSINVKIFVNSKTTQAWHDTVVKGWQIWSPQEVIESFKIKPKMVTKNTYTGINTPQSNFYIDQILVTVKFGLFNSSYIIKASEVTNVAKTIQGSAIIWNLHKFMATVNDTHAGSDEYDEEDSPF